MIFATNNKHKLEEIRSILAGKVNIQSLADIDCHADIPETGTTLEENALQKARYIWDHYHTSCFADDTGLEVEALGGAPGVYSARYGGGAGHDSEANMARLLRELEGKENRHARFRTVIALLLSPEDAKALSSDKESTSSPSGSTSGPVIHLFEGTVSGTIIKEKRGGEGFGYDPLFVPDGYTETFAQLGEEIKNKISHRAAAVKKLAEYLDPHQLPHVGES